MEYNETLKFVDVLPQLIYNYNNSIHSTINAKPADVMNNISIPSTHLRQDYVIPDFNIGDTVRYRRKLAIFDKKGLVNTYSKNVYTITYINNHKIKLSNNRYYDPFDLIKGNSNKQLQPKSAILYNDVVRKNKALNKFERLQKQEAAFKDIEPESQIINKKRIRTKNKKFD